MSKDNYSIEISKNAADNFSIEKFVFRLPSFFNTIIIFIILLSVGCSNPNIETNTATDFEIKNQFAKNFTIINEKGYKIISVSNLLDNSNKTFNYILYKKEKPQNVAKTYAAFTKNAIYLQVPLQRIACLSTTHIAMLAALEADTLLQGAANTNLIYNENIRKRVANQSIAMLGNESNLNYETLLALRPNGIFTYGLNDVSQIQKLQSLGLHPIVVAEFRENTPLARAEWIKFFAAFVEKETLADSIFSKVADDYLALQSNIQSISNLPTVFTGIPFQGTWYVPAGESYLATYIKDAGGDYLWKDRRGQLSLALDIETVFAKAHQAKKWMDVGFVFSKSDVASKDKRLTKFEAFQTGEMYNYTKRVHQGIGFDIYESAIVYPNIVLKDFVKILHPKQLENHELFYYEKIPK